VAATWCGRLVAAGSSVIRQRDLMLVAAGWWRGW
jgi:hypothetical protein